MGPRRRRRQAHLLRTFRTSAPWAGGRRHSCRRRPPPLRGRFPLAFCVDRALYAARDPHGVRPLVLGRLERGWVVASETAALDIVGATFVREVEPGELLAIDGGGLRSSRFAAPE